MFQFKKHCVIFTAGSRGSGKSYLTGHILETPEFYDQFDYIVIMCPSLPVNDDYWTPKLKNSSKVFYIHKVDEATIDDIFNQMWTTKATIVQEERTREMRQADPEKYARDRIHMDASHEDERPPELLLILDDIIDSGVVQFGGVVDKIAERGRHVNITCMVNSQRIAAVSRSVRINSDYVILFRPHSISELERFLEDYISKSARKELRLRVDEIYAQPHDFIMLDNGTPTHKRKLKKGNLEMLMSNRLEPIQIDTHMPEIKPQKGKRKLEVVVDEVKKNIKKSKKE